MLTREQKIDFLKCCIAAYEDERVLARLEACHKFTCGHYIRGFCDMLSAYNYYLNLPNSSLSTVFKGFYWTLDRLSCRYDLGMWNGLYKLPVSQEGYSIRARVAREFLLKEYGITVPKRKK
jgi:hypothetical protein